MCCNLLICAPLPDHLPDALDSRMHVYLCVLSSFRHCSLCALFAEGLELGEADDRVFGRTNSKQATGAVGLLSKDLITRQSYYEHAITLALIPFLNEELYKTPSVPQLTP